jgi:sulfur carrier protein ThiS
METWMKIFFINNFGGGFADNIDIEPETNITQLFKERMPGCKPQDYLIRVNRQPVPQDQVLHEGDRVSITPLKIEGAWANS